MIQLKLNKQKILILFFTLLTIALLGLVILSDFSLFHQTNLPHYDIFMTNVHGIKLDKFGKPHDEIFSPMMKHYEKDDMTTGDTPKLIFYGQKGPPWHITSDHGQMLNGNQKIILWDNVIIKQIPGPGSRNATLTTTKIYFYPDTSLANTDQPVTLTEPGSIMNGIGMQADLNKGTMKILSKTEGMYGDIK